MKKKHQFYDSVFKENAVQLSYQSNTVLRVSRELHIRANLLYSWRKVYEQFGPGCFCGKSASRKKTVCNIQAPNQNKDNRSKRRHYDAALKINAVLLSYKSRSFTALEKELGIAHSLLRRWRKEYEEFGTGSFSGSGFTRISPEKEKINALEKQCREAELRYEILKKAKPYLIRGRHAVYQFIKDHEDYYPTYKICRILEVGESGYRLWRKCPVSETKQRVISLKEKIKSLFFEYEKYYGCVKISEELQKRGTKLSRSRVGIYMQEMGLRPKAKRKYKATTDSRHNFYTSPNLLNQQFKSTAPSQVWVSDITYIQTNRRFLYLTIIMDLYDRKIIGWSLSSTMSAERTTIAAWMMATERREVKEGLIFHSDRGVQYACKSFTQKVDSHNCVIRSMSRRGNHFDNAAAESFFNTFKRELIYHHMLLTKNRVKKLTADFIENWYNKKRIHSSLQYQTVANFNTNGKA